MRGFAVVGLAMSLLAAAGCSSTGGGDSSSGISGASARPEAPVSANQARQIMESAGYTNIGNLHRSEDNRSWETTGMIDGVTYVVDVDNDGMLVSR